MYILHGAKNVIQESLSPMIPKLLPLDSTMGVPHMKILLISM